MAFAKFEENRFRIDGEIAENHAILVNMTASIVCTVVLAVNCFSLRSGFYIVCPTDGGGWSKMKVSFLGSSQLILKRLSRNLATIII